jgi:hypothetical protein
MYLNLNLSNFEMKEYNSEILKVVHTKLEMVDMESCNISIEEAESMINFLNDCLEEMRSYFLSLNAIDSSDEICFFKEIKGYATSVMSNLIVDADNIFVSVLDLYSTKAGKKLYEKLGFKEIEYSAMRYYTNEQ